MCGLSCYIVGFTLKGINYYWNRLDHCFKCAVITPDGMETCYKTPPVGAYNLIISNKEEV